MVLGMHLEFAHLRRSRVVPPPNGAAGARYYHPDISNRYIELSAQLVRLWIRLFSCNYFINSYLERFGSSWTALSREIFASWNLSVDRVTG
jgi:hypothetical protein